ncbi:CynX/NimT family MFS transporter [Shimazuella kribbensis]|uniref:MFS transporter n=1 Tax=Shimazuella kribbensis TaxID=139808 RepID=UPI0003F97951|nr:MFS transporter [Shimazuella kribbensis]
MGYSEVYAGNILTIFAVIQIPVGLVLPKLLQRFPSRLLWMSLAASIELLGFCMIFFSVQPWLAAVFIGLGAGTLFSLSLLLPIDLTKNSEEAAAWSAMIQSVGYVFGATGPFMIGLLHDTTNSFTIPIIGMIIINCLMIIMQCFAAPKKPLT